MNNFTRVFDIPYFQQQRYAQEKASHVYLQGNWKSTSIHDLIPAIECVAGWLIENEFRKGDTIAVMPRLGSTQWLIVDFACQMAGLVLVPVHPTAALEEVEFILHEADVRAVLTADTALYNRLISLQEKMHGVNFYHLEPGYAGYFFPLNLNQLHDNTRQQLAERKNSIRPEDLLAILYTSGTSGTPKGVMLTHYNVVSSIQSILPIFPLSLSHRVLSFLPFSHVFERTACFAYLAMGVQIYFSSSLEQLNRDFKTVKPHFCTTVPRTLEKMVDILNQKLVTRSRLERSVIRWAMRVGEKFKDRKKQGPGYPFKLFLARLLVLRTFRKALGGKIQFMVVGAAALRPSIGRLFSAAGIHTLPGYGMTETAPFISVNRPQPGLHRLGTVGIPVPGVEVRIDEPNDRGEGEIWVRGPNVMTGYFKRPEQTREVLNSDGWLRTGDVGRIENKRFLVITDRKKDIFKTSTGKYVSPQPLENHFTASPFILQCLIMGFNQPFVSAILVPNFSLLQSWCREQGIHWTAPAYMVHNIKVIRKMQEEVDRLNEKLQSHERVRKFILSESEWTVENKELTTSFKPRRQHLLEKHAKEIQKMYGGEGGS
jgi:long-chain acyl-CoA synthetase